jgi:hypothetical protein
MRYVLLPMLWALLDKPAAAPGSEAFLSPHPNWATFGLRDGIENVYRGRTTNRASMRETD